MVFTKNDNIAKRSFDSSEQITKRVRIPFDDKKPYALFKLRLPKPNSYDLVLVPMCRIDPKMCQKTMDGQKRRAPFLNSILQYIELYHRQTSFPRISSRKKK